MRRLAVILLLIPTFGVAPATAPAYRPTLPQIMADPDWIARSPERAYWGADSKTVYYQRKRENSDLHDLYRATPPAPATQPVPDADLYLVDPPGAIPDLARTRRLFERHGDLFIQDIPSGQIRALTSTAATEYDPSWMAGDTAIQFRRDGAILVRDLATGLEHQAADIRFEKSPQEKRKEEDDKQAKAPLAERQEKALFEPLRRATTRAREREDRALSLAKLDPTRVPGPFYLSEKLEATLAALSPDGQTILLVVSDREKSKPREEAVPSYVEQDGYVSARPARPLVGTPPRPNRLFVLDLKSETATELDLAVLPGISDDPLAELKAASRAATSAPTTASKPSASPETRPTTRPVEVNSVEWSRDGKHAAIVARSADHKDRWIALFSPGDKQLAPLHREHDPAWVADDLFDFGFTRDSSALYFTSEKTGFNHVYLHAFAAGETRPLTSGKFEVSEVNEDPVRPFLYAKANPIRPCDYEVIRIPLSGAPIETITATAGGLTRFSLSPDGSQLLLTVSAPLSPAELFLQPASPSATMTRLTDTVAPACKSFPWVPPQFVPIPTRDGKTVWTKVFLDPASPAPASGPASGRRPIVVFVHGAGYLQDVHSHWTYYFREQMFNSMLAQEGYVVLEPDYRGSAGYGRDWRTAIYRHMGSPELDDVEDAIAYAAREYHADPQHVGIYGGSYGGFLSLMAAFTRGHTFAAAAALRPVTDWAHYNHEYTSEILNTPDIDPQAYKLSSPIYYADGLSIPLLICHGIVDDNVFAQDTIRLQEKLIELGKENFEVALYPVESHGFENPSSWLDEYRRIHALFERYLK